MMRKHKCELQTEAGDRACDCTHGVVGELLSLVPGPTHADKGDPFLTLTGRAAKAWMALFAHARQHGNWETRSLLGMEEETSHSLTAHWTVQALAYVMGVNRDTAGKALKELTSGGWVKKGNARHQGQFGGIDYSLAVPATVTQADKMKVADRLKECGVAYRDYEWRTASRVLDERAIARVHHDVDLEIQSAKADWEGNDARSLDLAGKKVLRQRMDEDQDENQEQDQDEAPDVIALSDHRDKSREYKKCVRMEV